MGRCKKKEEKEEKEKEKEKDDMIMWLGRMTEA